MNANFIVRFLGLGNREKKIPENESVSLLLGEGIVPLSREESIALLIQAAPRLEKTDRVKIEKLAECLGDLPLALLLAGKYLDNRLWSSPDAYRAEIEKTAEDLPSALLTWASSSAIMHARSLAAVFLISYRLMRERGDKLSTAQQILLQASYCAPGFEIPDFLFQRSLADVDGNPNPGLDAAIDRLSQFGFLQVKERGCTIHPLLAALSRRLDDPGKGSLTILTETLLAASRDGVEKNETAVLAPLLPHMETAAGHAEIEGLAKAGALWGSLGHQHWIKGEYLKARACFERGLSLDIKVYGPVHEDVAVDHSNLGRTLLDIGDLYEAKIQFERALALGERLSLRQSPSTAIDAANLGRVLYKMGELRSARMRFEQALSIHLQAFDYGPRHQDTASDLYQLGLVLVDLGELQEAKNCFEKALSIDEWVFGPKHARVIADLNQLSKVLRATGQVEEAKSYLERLLELEGSISLLDRTKDTAAINRLGLVLQDLGNLSQARTYFEQALALDEATYGSNHHNVARDAANLACLLRDLGDLPAARVYFRQALAIYDGTPGHENREIAVAANNFGQVLYTLADLSGAKECFEQALLIDEKEFGPHHSEIATDLINLGKVVHELGDLDAAQALFERALSVLEQSASLDHPKALVAKDSLKRIKGQLRG